MYLQNHRSVQNGVPLDARHTNIALEMRKLGYAPVLAGYTDITPDPRLYAPHDPVLKTYEGILPGFHRVLAMPSTSFPEPWARWLEEQGFPLPAKLRKLYYNQVDNYPGAKDRGVTYAPAIYPKDKSDTAFITDLAVKFLHQPDSRPWFLHLSYLRPHPPYLAPEPYNRMYHPDEVPAFRKAKSLEEEAQQHPYLALLLEQNMRRGRYRAKKLPRDKKTLRQLRATYYGLMTEIDDQVGTLVTLLKETGQYENTVIIFVSDHGDQLGDHHLLGKDAYFDQGFHVPLIIRASGETLRQSRGQVVDAFTENVDIVPTILELFGADIPVQCDGNSLVPFLRSETPKHWRREAHWEKDFRYKEYRPGISFYEELGIDFEECTFNVIRGKRYKYVHFTALPPLLFDLKNDPDELHNLAGDPAYTEIVLKYAQKMLSWRMINDERTLVYMLVGPEGVVERPRTRL